MCITEIWTYQECGCLINRLIPCHNSCSAIPSDQFNNCTDFTRQCSIDQCIRKTFLVPICDDCFFGKLRRIPNSKHESMRDHRLNGEDWLLESHVEIKIEEESQNGEQHSSILESRSDGIIEHSISNENVDNRPDRPSTTSTCDADDEGESPHDSDLELEFRGRSLRRRGIDLMRGHLRIASVWSSDEKRNMEVFRNKLQGRKSSFASSLSSNEAGNITPTKTRRTKVTSGLQDLKQIVRARGNMLEVGRNRSSSVNRANNTTSKLPLFSNATLSTSGVVGNRAISVHSAAVPELNTDDHDPQAAGTYTSPSHVTDQTHPGHQSLTSLASSFSPGPGLNTVSWPMVSSWQDHLQHDLRLSCKRNSTHNSAEQARSRQAYKADLNFDNHEQFKSGNSERVLSDLSLPSIPITASHASSMSGLTARADQVLNIPSPEFESDSNHSIISEDEDEGLTSFDESVDEFITTQLPFRIDQEMSAENKPTDGPTYAPKHNVSTTSATTFDTVCSRPFSHSPPKDFSIALSPHPITTPLEIKMATRPSLPPRSSSLFSPPTGSPYRLGMDPQMKNSPTNAFVCVKEETVCMSCGKEISSLSGEVLRCICDLATGSNASPGFNQVRNRDISVNAQHCTAQSPVYKKTITEQVCSSCCNDLHGVRIGHQSQNVSKPREDRDLLVEYETEERKKYKEQAETIEKLRGALESYVRAKDKKS